MDQYLCETIKSSNQSDSAPTMILFKLSIENHSKNKPKRNLHESLVTFSTLIKDNLKNLYNI